MIAIIGILIGLLLPAVQAAREAARRISCVNNFKQAALALHNYESTYRHFPPGMNWFQNSRPCTMPPDATQSDFNGWGWSAAILPYVEQGSVHSLIDPTIPGIFDSEQNRTAASKRIPIYDCPSDVQGFEMVEITTQWQVGPHPDEDLGKSNAAGVADSFDYTCDGRGPRRDGDGILYNLHYIRHNEITDGTSHTLIVGEITGGHPGSHRGDYWCTWSINDTAEGINNWLTLPGGATTWIPLAGFSSYHPGGCHFALTDGSVQFIREDIDRAVLRSLTTRAGVSSDGRLDVPIAGEAF